MCSMNIEFFTCAKCPKHVPNLIKCKLNCNWNLDRFYAESMGDAMLGGRTNQFLGKHTDLFLYTLVSNRDNTTCIYKFILLKPADFEEDTVFCQLWRMWH